MLPSKHQMAQSLFDGGQIDDSIALLNEILEENPDDPVALNLYGIAMSSAGKLIPAKDAFDRLVQLRMDSAEAHANRGHVLWSLGEPDKAILEYERAKNLDPKLEQNLHNLGVAYGFIGQQNDAIKNFQEVVKLNPNRTDSWLGLGVANLKNGNLVEAGDCIDRALQLSPDEIYAYSCMADILHALGNLDMAEEYLTEALKRDGDNSIIHSKLADMLRDRGRLTEAVCAYRRSLSLKRDHRIHSALIATMHYWEGAKRADIAKEYCEWVAHYIHSDQNPGQFTSKNRDSKRKLRVGYVSNDFRNHVTAFFIEPVLASHDSSQFEIYCYDTSENPDEVTERLANLVHKWRRCAGVTDEQMDKQIREDGIDILVDLMGHTQRNRLLVFAKKPAPIQATWLGYPSTSGLDAMDYLITDRYIAGDEDDLDQYHTERLAVLPDFYMCFKPSSQSPEVNTLPAYERGFITFGSFNALVKITPDVLELWANVLNAIPKSRLVMLTVPDGSAKERVLEYFSSRGIERARIDIAPRISHKDFLRVHQVVDLALDPFPYNGTTTTLHGLWMGVPIITLEGKSLASRVGMSIMANLGLSEFIASTPEEYVEIAARQASDIHGLQALRSGLRGRMATSPLVDAKRFTHNLEGEYRRMWTIWCSGEPT